MNSDTRLDDLLRQYQDAARRGEAPDLRDLCRDCPELLDELRRRLADTPTTDAAPTRHSAEPTTPDDAAGGGRWRAGVQPVAGYVLLRRLGRGGFGEVWEASAPGGFRVAFKFVPLSGQAGTRELRALEIIRNLRHPNLLTIFGTWQEESWLIIGMELADETLFDQLGRAAARGQPGLPRRPLVRYSLDVARVIDYLNKPRHFLDGPRPVGIRHGDIKPQNILLVGEGVKVGDFGLVQLLHAAESQGGMTLPYAPPEVFDGRPSERSDQYPLAVAWCQLRGGRLPFVGSAAEVREGHQSRPPDLTMLPEEERAVVARALAKDPAARWPSCRAFIKALAEATRSVETTPPPREAAVTPPPPAFRDAEPRRPRSMLLYGMSTGLAVCLLGLMAWVVVLWRTPPPVGEHAAVTANVEEGGPRPREKEGMAGKDTPKDLAKGDLRDKGLPFGDKGDRPKDRPPPKDVAIAPGGDKDFGPKDRPPPGDSLASRDRKDSKVTGLEILPPKDGFPPKDVAPLPPGPGDKDSRSKDRPAPKEGPVPPPPSEDGHTSPPVTEAPPPSGPGWLPWLVGAAAVVLVGLVLWKVLRRRTAPPRAIAETDEPRPQPPTAASAVGDESRLLTRSVGAPPVVGGIREVRRLSGHGGAVWSVAVAPGGRLAASGGLDGAIRLWDFEGGREVAGWTGVGTGVTGVAFSPDGRLLASANLDGLVRVQEVGAERQPRRFEGHAGRVLAVAFSPDGRALASGGEDGIVRLWDVDGGREASRLTGHTGWVTALAFAPDGGHLLTAGQDGTLRRWDLTEGREIGRLTGHTGPVLCLALSPDGRLLASGGEDRTVRLWDVAGGIEVARLDGHADWVRAVAFTPDGRLLSGGDDETLRVWEVPSGRMLHRFDSPDGSLLSLAVTPDGRFALAGSDEQGVQVWALRE